jgi:hypothetical protein
MTGHLYPVGVSIRRDVLNGKGYIATVEGGHPKVRFLFAFGDNHKEARTSLAKLIYDTLDNSRFDLSKIEAITMIEAYVVPLKSLAPPNDDESGSEQ